MIAVYTNTIDYYHCTVVHMNSTKVVHANTIIILHKTVTVIAVYTNTIDYYYCTVVHTNSTKVLSLFYHRSGIIFVALVAKPRVATQYRFNEKPHTIANDMVSHHVITLFFVLLATRSIQKTVPSVGWYILPPKWEKRW